MHEKTRRLKHVATTLNVGTSTIVSYLAEQGIEVENKPTTKISGEQFELLIKAFFSASLQKTNAGELNVGTITENKANQSYELHKTNISTNIGIKVGSKMIKDNSYDHKDYNPADFITDDTPRILYKYRCWGEGFPYHQKLILENELFFSAPAKFNDPFDVSIPFRFDLLCVDEKERYCLDLANQFYPNLSLTKRKLKALEIGESSLFNDGSSLRALEEIRNNVGIVSLSKNRSNILMWSHYANSHKGICIGFNAKKLLNEVQCRLDEVSYSEDYPILKYILPQHEEVTKLLVTKSSFWQYEEEYRLIKANFPNKEIKLSYEVFEEVILGCQMPNDEKKALKNLISKKYKYVKILEAVQDKYQFKLTFTET